MALGLSKDIRCQKEGHKFTFDGRWKSPYTESFLFMPMCTYFSRIAYSHIRKLPGKDMPHMEMNAVMWL